jgi:hypothetical protein
MYPAGAVVLTVEEAQCLADERRFARDRAAEEHEDATRAVRCRGGRRAGRAVDAAADHTAAVLRVHAIHEDVIFTQAIAKAVRAELADLASWLGLAAVEPIL